MLQILVLHPSWYQVNGQGEGGAEAVDVPSIPLNES